MLSELLHLFVLLKVIEIDFENSIGLKGDKNQCLGKAKTIFSVSEQNEGKENTLPSLLEEGQSTNWLFCDDTVQTASFAEALSILLSRLVHILVRNLFKNRLKVCMKIGLTN